MNTNEACHAPRTSSAPHDSNPPSAGSAPPGPVDGRATAHPALEQLPELERRDGAGRDKSTDRRLHGFQSKQAGAAGGGEQLRPYHLPECPLPGRLPDELWAPILEAAGIPHEVDPLDIEHFTPESLRLLLDLRLTSQRLNRLTAPAHEALVLADAFVKGRATPFAKSSIKEFSRHNALVLDIPTVAYLQEGLRSLHAKPSEDDTQAAVVTTNRQKVKQALPKAKGQLKRLLGGKTAAAERSSAPAAAPPTPAVLRRGDLRRDGDYRQKLEELKIGKIEQLWPILEQAWPDSMGRGETPAHWVRPLTALCGLDLSPERKNPLLTQMVWPKLANLPVEARGELLSAVLMQRDLPDEMLHGAMRLLNEGRETNCGTRAYAQALGALAMQLQREPLEQRLNALNEMLADGGALFELPPEHLALALVPVANLDIGEASDAEKNWRFDQVKTLSGRLPKSSEMHRLLPRAVDDPHHMLVRIRRVQGAQYDPEMPDDGIELGNTPLTVDELLRIYVPRRPADEPMSLDDFSQMISIARVGYLNHPPEGFSAFLESHAFTVGCLKPEELLQGARILLVEMHRSYAIDVESLLYNLVGSVKGKSQAGEPLALLRVPANDLAALLGLLQREIDSPLTYNPRAIISRIEEVLCHRSDVETIRPQAKRWLESLVARHPYLIVDHLTNDPKLRLEPLSKFWQRSV